MRSLEEQEKHVSKLLHKWLKMDKSCCTASELSWLPTLMWELAKLEEMDADNKQGWKATCIFAIESYRDTMERLKLNEERKKSKSDADLQSLAKLLEWIEEGRDEH
jgi:hypothetical protein